MNRRYSAMNETFAWMPMEPIRTHKKRRNQSAQYHSRITKKWEKRFGYRWIGASPVMTRAFDEIHCLIEQVRSATNASHAPDA